VNPRATPTIPSTAPSAAASYAALTREQWRNYVSTFVPIENQLIQYATDRTRPQQAMQEASTDVNQSFDAQEGVLGRRLRGMGVSLTAEEQAAGTRSLGLNRALSDVQAQNMARDLTVQRQQSLLGNPAPTVDGALTGG
jgi:hypothetical protein